MNIDEYLLNFNLLKLLFVLIMSKFPCILVLLEHLSLKKLNRKNSWCQLITKILPGTAKIAINSLQNKLQTVRTYIA